MPGILGLKGQAVGAIIRNLYHLTGGMIFGRERWQTDLRRWRMKEGWEQMPCFTFSFMNISPMALTPFPSRMGSLYSAKDIYSIIHGPYHIIGLKRSLLYLVKHLISSLQMPWQGQTWMSNQKTEGKESGGDKEFYAIFPV